MQKKISQAKYYHYLKNTHLSGQLIEFFIIINSFENIKLENLCERAIKNVPGRIGINSK